MSSYQGIIFNIPIEKLRSGDPAAFEELLKTFHIAVFNFLLVKTRGNKEVAEDVLSETFCSALVSAQRIQSLDNIQGWLISIAFRRLNDYLKKEYRQRDRVERLKENKRLENTNNEEDVTDDEKIVVFKLALANLKAEYRQVIEFKYMERKSQAEIAAVMAKTQKAVEGLLNRARKALEAEMERLVPRMRG